MTDPSGLTPEQDAVRRLLADARHDAPVPPEVVTRLDEALASLVSERRSAADESGDRRPPTAPVVDLGARRRRMAGIGLLAAAAVVVAGVAIGQGLPRMQGSDDSADSSTAGGDASLAESPAGEDSDGESDSGTSEMGPETLKSIPPAPQSGSPTLSSTDLDLDDELLQLRSNTEDSSERVGVAEALSGCDLRGIGRGRRVVAQVDGQVGIVVFRRADGDAQQADLYVCGIPEPVRTLTLPAP